MNDANQGPTPAPVPAEPAPAAPAAEPAPQPAQPTVPPISAPVTPAPQPAPQPQEAGQRDRTSENFEKLIESNKRLAEANDILRQEIAKRADANQQFAPIQQVPQQPTPPVEQINPEEFTLVDPLTGDKFIDEPRLRARIQEVTERATKAEQAVNNYIQASEQREVEKQEKEAYAVYPELERGNEKFDENFHKQTRALIYDSLINPTDYKGKPLTFKEAADAVKQQMGQVAAPAAPTPEETQAAQAAQAAQEAKDQATQAVAGQQPEARQNQQGEELIRRLSQATRLGDDEALAIRIMNSDHVGTPSSEEES